MSAFILDPEHIDIIIDGAIRMELIPQNHLDQIGQLLADQNYRSVNHRYDEDRGMAAAEAPRYRFRPFPYEYSRSDLDMAARSYRYQSCETSDYADTAAGHLIEAIILANEIAALEADPEWVTDDESPAWVVYPGMDWYGEELPRVSAR